MLGQSDADGDRFVDACERVGIGLHGLAYCLHVGERLCVGGFGDQQREFLTADTACDILLAQGVANGMGYLPQYLVAGLVAVGIVDALEQVHVQDGEGQRSTISMNWRRL